MSPLAQKVKQQNVDLLRKSKHHQRQILKVSKQVNVVSGYFAAPCKWREGILASFSTAESQQDLDEAIKHITPFQPTTKHAGREILFSAQAGDGDQKPSYSLFNKSLGFKAKYNINK